MSKIVINGILTNYQVIGDGKEALLILPGWKRSINEWVPVAKSLSNKYRVILLDLPGFNGATAFPKEIFGVFEYADFVKKFLEKIKIDKCTILGHSFGGRIAIVLASEEKIAERLILVDSAGIENKSLYTKLMRILKVMFSPVFMVLPISFKNKIGDLIGSQDYKTSGEMHRTFVKVVNQDLRPFLPKITVPTFVIWGDKDPSLPVSQTKIFKQEIKGVKIRIVWGAGHNPHIEKPEQLTSILKDIL
jgi:pimeloyl-ACP methyl ester carboxylesterase